MMLLLSIVFRTILNFFKKLCHVLYKRPKSGKNRSNKKKRSLIDHAKK